MNLVEKIKAAIEREQLIPEGAHVFVAVSGGADSVALLHILYRLGINVIAAHLNHFIRGTDADADEQFVKDLCTKLGVECVTARTDVPALAREKGISLEMAAREARHQFFQTLGTNCVEVSYSVRIVLAHHADDQLETFFLRAARGTGPVGLGGMKRSHCLKVHAAEGGNVDTGSSPRSPEPADAAGAPYLHLVRPLLSIRRAEILDWLVDEGLEWREDVSNLDESIPRNRVRHQILPTLGEINERAAENILRTMEVLRDEEDHPEKAAARREARDRLIEFGASPTFDAIEQFVEFSSRTDGTTFLDLEGVRLINEYGKVGRAVPGEPKTVTMKEGVGILRGDWAASISLEKIAGRGVTVRTPRPGDRMNPHGMDGSKKLQDIFTDLKIPQQQRAQWPVVECGGEIVWLPGYRIARGWELPANEALALHLFCDGSRYRTRL